MNRQNWIYLSLCTLLIAGTAALLVWLRAYQRLGPPGVKLDLPEQVLDYSSVEIPITPEEIYALPKDTTFARRLYSRVVNGHTNDLLLSVVLMGSDRTSIHKPQMCLTGQGWQIQTTERHHIPVDQPHAYQLPVMELVAQKKIQNLEARGIYTYWFVADQSITADHWQRMWWMAKNLLFHGVLQRWAYISCFVTCAPGQEEAARSLARKFIASAVPKFQLASGPITR